MGGNYSRIKEWIAGEVLTASDLNGEFNNEIDNAIPASIDDASANSTAMQATADPYPGASASLATSITGELQRLRYQINQIATKLHSGQSYWYEDVVFAPLGEVTAITFADTPYTALATDETILVDATDGAVEVDLPTAVGIEGKEYIIKKTDSSANAVTIDPSGSETIDGVSTSHSLASQYDWLGIKGDNANWQKVSEPDAAGTATGGLDNVRIVNGATFATDIDIDADQIVLWDSETIATRGGKVFTDVNVTIDITASGANGLDTGAEATSTTYYAWLLGKADGTVCGVLSVESAFADVTKPTDYIYGRCLGTAYNDSGDDLEAVAPIAGAGTTEFPAHSMVSNGHSMLPDGRIEQWGLTGAVGGDSDVVVTFPIAFPNACLNVQATPYETTTNQDTSQAYVRVAPSTTQVTLHSPNANSTEGIYWRAIGY